MYDRIVKMLTTFFATRPIWGLFPLRIVFALVLIFETDGLFFPLAIFVAVFLIMGFLGRAMGGILLLASLPMFFTGAIGAADALFFVTSLTLLMSGPGRFSLDRYIARKILEQFPNHKKELYVIAETPFTDRWYE